MFNLIIIFRDKIRLCFEESIRIVPKQLVPYYSKILERFNTSFNSIQPMKCTKYDLDINLLLKILNGDCVSFMNETQVVVYRAWLDIFESDFKLDVVTFMPITKDFSIQCTNCLKYTSDTEYSSPKIYPFNSNFKNHWYFQCRCGGKWIKIKNIA